MSTLSRGLLPRKLASRFTPAFILFLIVISTALSLGGVAPPARAAQLDNQVSLIQGCLTGSVTLPRAPIKVAYVVPTFTLTPYESFNSSFYSFYLKYKHDNHHITNDLFRLQTPAVDDRTVKQKYSDETPFYNFLKSPAASRCGLVLGQNLQMTNDQAVDAGALFTRGTRNYDVIILGHEEYVTRAEYAQMKSFVATGGRIVAMSGNTFYAQVNYSRSTHIETFVAGHGFEFNGKYAWRTDYEPFDHESSGWFGSIFANGIWTLTGARIANDGPFGSALSSAVNGNQAFTTYRYPHDEVNSLVNRTNTEVIARFYERADYSRGNQVFWNPPVPVDAYTHAFRRGEVVCLCIFGADIIEKDLGAQFFLVYGVERGASGPQLPAPSHVPTGVARLGTIFPHFAISAPSCFKATHLSCPMW